jgi:ElaB/YqjD/DUF883 family membrane-anchored ribosome-binding protein
VERRFASRVRRRIKEKTMNENKTEGAAKVVVGKLESAAGEVLGDGELQARGNLRQVGGHVQEVAGSVQEALGQAAGQARAAVSKATDAYGRASDTAHDIARRVEPFVDEQPYVALGLAAAVGLLVGLLIAGRGPKIVYVRPRA